MGRSKDVFRTRKNTLKQEENGWRWCRNMYILKRWIIHAHYFIWCHKLRRILGAWNPRSEFKLKLKIQIQTQNVELVTFFFSSSTVVLAKEKRSRASGKFRSLADPSVHLLLLCTDYWTNKLLLEICFGDISCLFFLLFAVLSVKITKSIRQNNKN